MAKILLLTLIFLRHFGFFNADAIDLNFPQQID